MMCRVNAAWQCEEAMFCNDKVIGRVFARARGSAMIAAAVLLLSSCSGQLPLLSGMQSADEAQPVTTAASAPVKRMRITRRDILSEWSTFGIDPIPGKRRKIANAAQLQEALDVPDYSLTIDQIMANELCRSCDEKPYHQMVVNASNRHGVPTSLIHAVIQKESGYNPKATSPKRARGLMQVTPDTAKFMGVRNSLHLYDPQTNIYAGTAYLKYLMTNHDTVEEVLAAYNAGPGNVRKYKGVPPFRETKRYVRDVKKFYAVTAK